MDPADPDRLLTLWGLLGVLMIRVDTDRLC
jgi:hypothetical protein